MSVRVQVPPGYRTGNFRKIVSCFFLKKDVIRKFGFTNNKQNEEGIEIWYYDFGIITSTNTRISK